MKINQLTKLNSINWRHFSLICLSMFWVHTVSASHLPQIHKSLTYNHIKPIPGDEAEPANKKSDTSSTKAEKMKAKSIGKVKFKDKKIEIKINHILMPFVMPSYNVGYY